MPPQEQHPFSWEIQWSSIPCSWSLPELCCRSSLPGHVPCWTSPSSLARLSGSALDLLCFNRCVWRSLTFWLTLITVTRPALVSLRCCGSEPVLVRVLPQLTLLLTSLLSCPPQESTLLLQFSDNLRVSNKIKILLGMPKLPQHSVLFLSWAQCSHGCKYINAVH